VEWLAGVGARWGLPADACRVHGLLYLMAGPLSTDAIAAELALTPTAMDEALTWLAAEELVTENREGWTTEADPWLLMLQTLEKRRQRELAPALAVLGPSRRFDGAEDPLVARQAKRLLELVEDLAAIDAGTKRLSPRTLRRVIGIGGRAVRLFGGASNRGGSL
jgi:DNA-binding transcriptional regulator GbsR (MarR family)